MSDELARAIEKFVEKFRNLEEWDDALLAKIEKLETRDGLRTAAIAALRDAGRPAPSDAEVEAVVDSFVAKRYTARRAPEPSSVPAIDWSKPGTFYVGDKAFPWDPAKHKEAAATTHDPARRLEAHARHLKNLDSRLKRVEHDGKAP